MRTTFVDEYFKCPALGNTALFRLPAQISFLVYTDCIQIDFRKYRQQKHKMRPLKIGSKPHLEKVWNAIPIIFLQVCLSPDAVVAQAHTSALESCVTSMQYVVTEAYVVTIATHADR